MNHRAVPALLAACLFLGASASAQIPWSADLEKGLADARDRDAPVFALLWDYN